MPTHTTGQVVTHNSRGWLALQDSTNVEPVEGADWTELAPWEGEWTSRSNGYGVGDYVWHGTDVFVADFTPSDWDSFTGVLTRNPVFFDDLVILPDQAGSTAPLKFDGTNATATLGGSPPTGVYACVHRSRLVIADGSRVYFSAVEDPETWDTVNSYIPVSAPITGLASLYDRLLVWSDRRLEVISGATPPPGTDMTLRPMFDVGCSDNRSIVVVNNTAIWANSDGVYLTEGAALVDMTEKSGVKSFWSDLIGAYGSALLPAGVYRNHYVIRVGETLCVWSLIDGAFFTFSNVPASMFTHSGRIREELYFGLSTEARAATFSEMFTTNGAADPDGTDIEPEWESRFFTNDLGVQSIRNTFARYMLDGDDVTLALGYTTSPHETTYADAGDLAATGFSYERLPVDAQSLGIAYRILQEGASEETHIHALAADVHLLEQSRTRSGS